MRRLSEAAILSGVCKECKLNIRLHICLAVWPSSQMPWLRLREPDSSKAPEPNTASAR